MKPNLDRLLHTRQRTAKSQDLAIVAQLIIDNWQSVKSQAPIDTNCQLPIIALRAGVRSQIANQFSQFIAISLINLVAEMASSLSTAIFLNHVLEFRLAKHF